MEVNAIAMMPDLRSLSKSGQEAFDVVLPDLSHLQAIEIVRRVPNRRLVCRGVWHHQPIYAKFFIGEEAKRYALRDKQGVEYLTQAHISTPALIYAGSVDDDSTKILIFKSIEHSENAEVSYQKNLNKAANFELALKLVGAVAQHHNANLLQTDLYLKNFLIKDGLIYTLDGDGIRKYAKLSRYSALKNLSILLSKFDVLEIENWLPDLLKTYAEASASQIIPEITLMKRLANRHRNKVANNYADKKVFRSCTDVQINQNENWFSAVSNKFPLNGLPKTPQDCDALIDSQLRIKSGNTCTVVLAKIDGVGVVIKRYNIKNFWHGVNRSLRQTRAARSWSNAHRLSLLGIATATPIALIEQRNFGLRGRAYFLSEYIEAPDVSEFFSQTTDKALEADAIASMAKLFYRLHLMQISHGDMKASNIKIVNGSPLLIDLDSMQQHYFDWVALRAHARDLKRFMLNWQEMPGLYNAFIEALKVVYIDHRVLYLARIIQ